VRHLASIFFSARRADSRAPCIQPCKDDCVRRRNESPFGPPEMRIECQHLSRPHVRDSATRPGDRRVASRSRTCARGTFFSTRREAYSCRRVMPAQTDASELGMALRCERRPVVRLPDGRHVVSLQHSRNPRRPEAANRFAPSSLNTRASVGFFSPSASSRSHSRTAGG
jgi:hypothetical protein